MAVTTNRVATGRRATPTSPSWAEEARIELARPMGPSVLETAAVAGRRLAPPGCAGQDSNLRCPKATGLQPAALAAVRPTHVSAVELCFRPDMHKGRPGEAVPRLERPLLSGPVGGTYVRSGSVEASSELRRKAARSARSARSRTLVLELR